MEVVFGGSFHNSNMSDALSTNNNILNGRLLHLQYFLPHANDEKS